MLQICKNVIERAQFFSGLNVVSFCKYIDICADFINAHIYCRFVSKNKTEYGYFKVNCFVHTLKQGVLQGECMILLLYTFYYKQQT